MARAIQSAPRRFDDAQLSTMVEPLTVRVERLKGTSRTPMPLPAAEGSDQPAGTGWTKDDLRGLEQWLVNEWVGGGLYEISVTDSSTPNPIVMRWQPYWDPKVYPERTPPTLTQEEPGGSVVPIVQPQPQQRPPLVPAFPHGFPQGIPQQQYVQSPFASPYGVNPFYPPPMPTAPMPGTPQWNAWKDEAERREHAGELARLRETNATREREAQEAKHKAELERERQASEARFVALQQTVTQQNNALNELRTMLAQAATATKPNAEVEALREQMRVTEARAERERAEREAERREASMRELITTMNTNMQAQLAESRRQADDRMRALELAGQNKGPDPMIAMFQEAQRQQADALKEMSRNSLAQVQQLQTFMMNPREMMSLARESTQSVDQATERVTRFFGSVIDTQQRVTENLLQLQPGGSGAIDVVRDGLTGVKEMAEKWFSMKSLDARLQQEAEVQKMEMQVRAVEAAQGHVRTPQPPRQEGQLAGPPIQPDATPITSTNGVTKGPKRLGRTDEEWFTRAVVPEVIKLREAALEFEASIKADPVRIDDKGNPVGASPTDAASFVIQAVAFAQTRNVLIPALMDLLFVDRFSDFVDVLLPDSIQGYRDDATYALINAARQVQGKPPLPPQEPVLKVGKPADTDDGDEDDDEDDGDDPDQKDPPVETKPPMKPSKITEIRKPPQAKA